MIFARLSAVVGIVGAVVVVIGSFGTWATIGSFSVSGIDGGGDGWITLVLAIVTGGLCAGVLTPPAVARVVRWIPLPFALLSLLVALVDIADISSTSNEFASGFGVIEGSLSVGWGLWVVLAGAIVASVAGVLLMFAPFPKPPRQAFPVPAAYAPGGYGQPAWQQPYPPQPYPGQYPPQQPYPPQPYPPQAQPYPPQVQPPAAPAPPAWPTQGPAYPGSTDPGDSADRPAPPPPPS